MLITICVYPITDAEQRYSILKSCSTTGNIVKKYQIQQKSEHNINSGTETQIYVHCEDMSIYGLLEHVEKQREQTHMAYYIEHNEDTITRMGNYRIVTSQRGLCKS